VPRYLVERVFDRISDEDMLAVAVRSEEACATQFPELTWERTHVCVGDDGGVRTFCVFTAPQPEDLRRHAEVLGLDHALGRIWEIVG
jgi:hypothetical protein